MQRHFHEDLRTLTGRVGDMGTLVEGRVHAALIALMERRPEMAVDVVSGDDAVNQLELEIDDLCIRFLATQGPVASDLRLVRSIIKVITDLERIGDRAVNLAQAVVSLSSRPPLRPVLDVSILGETSVGMLHDSVVAFTTQDVELAHTVLAREDRADSMRDSIFRVLMTYMMADTAVIERALGLMQVSRCLERIADHATNIAEETVFVVEGRVIRHAANALNGAN
jgi:phosphate transport system protein